MYEFVDARLDEELRAEYPTADSEPVVDVYRVRLGEAQAAHRGFVEAVHRGDQDAARLAWGKLGGIAERWQAPTSPARSWRRRRRGWVAGEQGSRCGARA